MEGEKLARRDSPFNAQPGKRLPPLGGITRSKVKRAATTSATPQKNGALTHFPDLLGGAEVLIPSIDFCSSSAEAAVS
jgi:hypothetical protein